MKLVVVEPGPQTDPQRPKTNGISGHHHEFRFERGSHVELAKAMLQELESVADGKLKVPIYDEGALYRYDPSRGIWARVDDDDAGKIVQGFDGFHAGKNYLKLKENDVKGALSCARREAKMDRFFADAPPGLAFRNGLVQVKSDGSIDLVAHSPDHRVRFAYEFDYLGDEPARFLETLQGMFKPDADADAKIQLIGEFAGTSLLSAATRLQRWILLKGLGDDGKSTLIDMIRSAMPWGSTCSIRPEDLEDEYSRADLAGKLLNTVTEVKQRDILNAETLKAVTVGDEMRGRHIRQSWISFRPLAGHMMAANGYPKFSDSSHGFWRRPIVVTFNRRFTGDPEREVGRAESVMAVERAQVVCWLVRQGAKALARGKYIEPPSHAPAIKEWRGETDAVFEFIEQSCVLSNNKTPGPDNGWSTPTAIYTAFLDWAQKTGHRPMSSTAFGRRLTELGHPDQKDGRGKRLRPLRLLVRGEVKQEDGNLRPN